MKKCFMCDGPADPLLLNMCKPCFQIWTDAMTAQWLKASRRQLEAVRAAIAAKGDAMKQIAAGVLIAGLFLSGFVEAKERPVNDLSQMTAYADNAILDAAQTGRKAVTLKFGHADPELIEKVADELRARGYRLDEEAAILNPEIVKVRGLKSTATAKR